MQKTDVSWCKIANSLTDNRERNLDCGRLTGNPSFTQFSALLTWQTTLVQPVTAESATIRE
jgi:hypothetical protein